MIPIEMISVLTEEAITTNIFHYIIKNPPLINEAKQNWVPS